MVKNESYQKDIENLLNEGYKIFLDKKCECGYNRHVFYKKKKNNDHHFYHVRYILNDTNEVESLKDYPAITISNDNAEDLGNHINSIIDQIMKFIKVNGYEVSCDRREM